MMTAYHQMGHHSRNLLFEEHLNSYKGAILSPVDYNDHEIRSQIEDRQSDDFEMIFDPQLYYPHTQRRIPPDWPYFPADFDTGDQNSFAWWNRLLSSLTQNLIDLMPSFSCSPAVVPRVYSSNYYVLHRDIAVSLADLLANTNIKVLQTLIVRLEDLSQPSVAPEIASIVTASELDRVYLVLVSASHPRRELHETEDLKGAMLLIRLLSDAGINVLVGFSSSDLILWKTAGADACATGKFFNLRRFTPSRWEPPPEGGGQLPYWFEESLFAFLRESDLVRVRRAEFISDASLSNPYSQQILERLDEHPGTPWLGLSWRQHMYWFADMESRLSESSVDSDSILKTAEDVWDACEANNILMEERANDGSWLRSWRRAILETF